MTTGTRVPIVTMTVTMATWQLVLHDLSILHTDASANTVSGIGTSSSQERIRHSMAPEPINGERLAHMVPTFVAPLTMQTFWTLTYPCCALELCSLRNLKAMAPIASQTMSDAEPSASQSLSPLSAFGRQAHHFRCQLTSGLQQRFDGAVSAFRNSLPQDRYETTMRTVLIYVCLGRLST